MLRPTTDQRMRMLGTLRRARTSQAVRGQDPRHGGVVGGEVHSIPSFGAALASANTEHLAMVPPARTHTHTHTQHTQGRG